MDYIVLIKQVPDPEKKVGMTEAGTVDREASEPILNPYDAHALEAAIRIKEKHGGTITAISMGPPKAELALREALAMGADEAILLSDRKMAASDTLATAYTLSCAIKKLGKYDIIFCGMQAIDGDTAQVGPQVAERLGISQVTYVEDISIEADGTAKLRRVIEGGYEILKTNNPISRKPILLTLTNTANEPRIPGVLGIKRASRKKITVWGVQDLESSPEKHSAFGQSGSPTWVKKIERPQSDRPPVKLAEGKTPDELVDSLVRLLKADGITLV